MIFEKGKDFDYFISPKAKLQEVAGKGLGIVAIGDFKENEIIECCPVMLVTYDKELKWNWLKRMYKASVIALFDDYLWWWRGKKSALFLGYGNLYNHSDSSNSAHYKLAQRKAVFVAKRKIQSGEEITIDYGYQPFAFQDSESASS